MPGRASKAALSAELSSTRSQFQPSWGYERVGLWPVRLSRGLSVCGELPAADVGVEAGSGENVRSDV